MFVLLLLQLLQHPLGPSGQETIPVRKSMASAVWVVWHMLQPCEVAAGSFSFTFPGGIAAEQ